MEPGEEEAALEGRAPLLDGRGGGAIAGPGRVTAKSASALSARSAAPRAPRAAAAAGVAHRSLLAAARAKSASSARVAAAAAARAAMRLRRRRARRCPRRTRRGTTRCPTASAPRELSAPRGGGEDGDGAGSAAARATRYGKTPLATLDAPRDARLTAGCARRFFFTPGPVSSASRTEPRL